MACGTAHGMSVFLDGRSLAPGVTIGADTVIWPNTYLQGKTSIGQGCELGPNTHIRNTQTGNGCKIFMCVLEGAVLVSGITAACKFQEADCSVDPRGMWGPPASAVEAHPVAGLIGAEII